MGLGRTGASGSNGSGDYAITFSTAVEVRIRARDSSESPYAPRDVRLMSNDALSPLFLAVVEATVMNLLICFVIAVAVVAGTAIVLLTALRSDVVVVQVTATV